MSRPNGDGDKDRDAIIQCIADAYQTLDVIPGVDPNGPCLVWLAEKLLELRRQRASV
jgi:hypothetical protein